jgi:NAD-dependent SIR2 family protein deacetylase
MQARPFADIAWNDTDQNLQVALDELAEQEGIDKLLEPMTENIDTFFQGAGFKSS